jgi:acyl carrier protein
MNRTAFYSEIEELLELPKGTVRGDNELSKMPEWDSLAVISFIALADSKYGVILQGKKVEACLTVDDLAASIEEHK